jgi:glyoxylase-like metal-dependent hydrolase (beta-lactamase superfamily II)
MRAACERTTRTEPVDTLWRVSCVERITMAYNNVYIVDRSGGRLLVDTGPDYRGARQVLEAHLQKTPNVVVATHGHLDHAGLGHYWRERGVPVVIGGDDAHLARSPQLSDPAEFDSMVAFVHGAGTPPLVATEAIAGLGHRREWAVAAARSGAYAPIGRDGRWPTALHYEHFQPSSLLSDGDTLGDAELCVIASPGHTPGNLVLVDRSEGWLFSGDQLLPEITPTPAIQRAPPGSAGDWRFRSLPAFVGSLKLLRSMAFTRCFPGHGEPFDDVHTVIEANLSQIEQRSERVEEALRELGTASLYGICDALYPRALRRRFWQIVATVQGHLDLLEAAGRVTVAGGTYAL